MRVLIDLQACQSPGGRIRGVGRYCLALAKAMALAHREHEVWFLLNGAMVSSAAFLRDVLLDVVPQERVVCWQSVPPTAAIDPANHVRGLLAERVREQYIEAFHADVVLTMSMVDGYGDAVVTSVRPGSSALQVAIVFDLIPLVVPEVYLANPNVATWYMRKLEHLRRCDLLLGISDFTTREASNLLGVADSAVVNISAAVDPVFKVLSGKVSAIAVGRKYGIVRPFVMYAGGYDPRKNLVRLIEAYAALPTVARETYQLVFVGGIGEPELVALKEARDAHGLSADELVFTGFVSDDELVRFYNACALYAFPSTHEGFGLPALEAMSCGAVVVGSNTTSLPEVIDCDEALFDPYDVSSIAAALRRGLTDDDFRGRMRTHGLEQAKRFSWSESARRAWEAIECRFEARKGLVPEALPPVDRRSRRIALLSAGPPDRELATLLGRAEVFGDLGNQVFAHATLPSGWKKHSIHSFIGSMFDEVYVDVRNEASSASLLIAAKDCYATLLPHDETCDAVAQALTRENPTLLAAMLYGWGGYSALGRREAVDGLAALPMALLGFGSPRWRVANPSRLEESSIASSNIDELVSIPGVSALATDDLSRLAAALAENSPPRFTQRVLYVDISQLVLTDAGTGIQRVVRHVVAEMLDAVPDGFRVEPVYIHPGDVFRYARSYVGKRFHGTATLPGDSPVDFRQGDIFLGLDLAAHLVPAHKSTFVRMRSLGVKVTFVVYDMLPLLRPDCFDPPGLPTFRAWYEAIAEVADGIVAISRTVADEFKRWLPQAGPSRSTPLRLGWFHLGADLAKGVRDVADPSALPSGLDSQPTLLMVGTVEPRKGHGQALAAFEVLWRRGIDVNLVIVGKQGWHVEKLASRLRNHPERGKRLFWLEKANDNELISMYHAASGLLAASEGEGFGLPLIEAAQYGLPIVARDLPVFREVAGEHAYYFSGLEAESLADAVERWIDLRTQGYAPESRGMPWLTWQQSAAQLVDVVVGGAWQDSWSPGGDRRFLASDYRADATTGALARECRATTRVPGLLFGTPGIEVAAGRYSIRIAGDFPVGSGSAWVDVVAQAGRWRVVSDPLVHGVGTIGALDVVLDEDISDLQVRIMVDAEAELVFRSVEIVASEIESST
ncbi:MAG TPA: glycosyltransferase family 1 protein [Luteibacter sp.]|uniref:glycosyltransferase family 4 protein n=1 Tax=Luteibacter sp. TaxID=1886636 RepID=UPI002C8DC44F|nr:glycosyltransferase family 1 protein [Luteibacter sp.]HVI53956.1 glycosyltransferase family 1 protein [Luteibacter sp.]